MPTDDFLDPYSTLRQNNAVVQVATAVRFFTAEECRRVLAISEKIPKVAASVDNIAKATSARNTEVRFLLPDDSNIWIFRKLYDAIQRLNESYRFNVSGFEGLQVATYHVGDFYDWHIDIGGDRLSTRKLSLSLQLSDSGDYDGGELEFMNIGSKPSREIGTLIAFPSFLMHRVTPVTRGVRKSLVAWIRGEPFR